MKLIIGRIMAMRLIYRRHCYIHMQVYKGTLGHFKRFIPITVIIDYDERLLLPFVIICTPAVLCAVNGEGILLPDSEICAVCGHSRIRNTEITLNKCLISAMYPFIIYSFQYLISKIATCYKY